jgi:ADP-heptose:LPS heptosyltransferase
LAELLPVFSVSAEFFSLQKHVRDGDRLVMAHLPQLHQNGDSLHSFSDTAALISCLDLVIAVDTAVVHLAGAMGKPVWVMLPFAPDWRWLLERSDTPWYRSVRLFRQPRIGDWKSVVGQIVRELESGVI